MINNFQFCQDFLMGKKKYNLPTGWYNKKLIEMLSGCLHKFWLIVN